MVSSSPASAGDENKTTTTNKGDDGPTTTTTKKVKVKSRKDMPSVAYMLQHGNPETAHLPKTKMEIYGYPIILALIFAISLLIFHHAPHDKSTRATNSNPFVLNTNSAMAGRRQQFQQQQQPNINTNKKIVVENEDDNNAKDQNQEEKEKTEL